MDARRRRFLFAALAFAAWILALLGMIALEGRNPPPRTVAPPTQQAVG